MKKFDEFIFANSNFDVLRGIYFRECPILTCFSEFDFAKRGQIRDNFFRENFFPRKFLPLIDILAGGLE